MSGKVIIINWQLQMHSIFVLNHCVLEQSIVGTISLHLACNSTIFVQNRASKYNA